MRQVRGVLLTCQSGFESLLARELAELHGQSVVETGPGWVRIAAAILAAAGTAGHGPGPRRQPDPAGSGPGAAPPAAATEAHAASVLPELAFAHLTLTDPIEVRGNSVNALAAQVTDFLLERLRGERIEAAWPALWLGAHDQVGLGRRLGAVEAAWQEQLKRKLARVAKLATPDMPRVPGRARGLFVYFTDFGRAFVARNGFLHGPRRMADDPQAPSRSYLKVEEAYVVLGREPAGGETVCDLGAAPGGWSYSAAKRGARVAAIDNGPLKGGALDHPLIEHRREDAFRFAPDGGAAFDWLFCDMVEEPHHVLRDIVVPWLSRGWCRRFVVNLKFGRVDPIGLLRELRAPGTPLGRHAPALRVRHLYHDREEFTLVGEAVLASAPNGG